MALTKISTDGVKDDAVTLAKQAGGTDGQIITYDASGNPVAVGPGTDGQVLTSTGAGSPPAFEDLPTSGAALTGSTNNTVCTVTGANAIQGEANLTFDGNQLKISHGSPEINLYDTTNNTNCYIFSDDNGSLRIQADQNSSASDTRVRIQTDGTERVSIDEHLKILDGNLIIGTSGHGIDFSAQTASSVTGATTGAEVLDSYEEGTWTPITSIGAMHTMHGAHYTKIGRLVNCQCYVTMPTSSASTHVKIDNLPFTSLGSNHYGIGAAYCQWQGNDHFFFQMSPSANHGYPHVGLGNAVTHATASGGYYLMSVTYFTA